MKKFFVILMFPALVSCDDEDQYASSGSTTFISATPNIKAYRKNGSILKIESFEKEKTITMWNNYMAPKEAVYRFKPGERVVVYGKVGEYLFLSPSTDTTLAGYILGGWIEFDENNKNDMAAIPELKTMVGKGNPQLVVNRNNPNLERILRKNMQLKKDTIVFDENHLLQDEIYPKKRADTIALFFEKH